MGLRQLIIRRRPHLSPLPLRTNCVPFIDAKKFFPRCQHGVTEIAEEHAGLPREVSTMSKRIYEAIMLAAYETAHGLTPWVLV